MVPDVSEVVEVGSDVAVFEDVTLDVIEPYDPPPTLQCDIINLHLYIALLLQGFLTPLFPLLI